MSIHNEAYPDEVLVFSFSWVRMGLKVIIYLVELSLRGTRVNVQ